MKDAIVAVPTLQESDLALHRDMRLEQTISNCEYVSRLEHDKAIDPDLRYDTAVMIPMDVTYKRYAGVYWLYLTKEQVDIIYEAMDFWQEIHAFIDFTENGLDETASLWQVVKLDKHWTEYMPEKYR